MRFLRRALWLRFHLWTLGFLVFLSAVNVSTQVRSYDTSSSLANSAKNGPAVLLSESAGPDVERNPASAVLDSVFPSSSDSGEKSARTRALKLASLGCEPHLKLSLAKDVRQLRLKFEDCPIGSDAFDDIVRVSNTTNGFQATVFSADSIAASGADSSLNASQETEVPGVFVAAESKTPKPEKVKNVRRVRHPASDPISTDYISLAEGANEIRIQRTDREQRLQIVRK